jgi:hypothetical protein
MTDSVGQLPSEEINAHQIAIIAETRSLFRLRVFSPRIASLAREISRESRVLINRCNIGLLHPQAASLRSSGRNFRRSWEWQREPPPPGLARRSSPSRAVAGPPILYRSTESRVRKTGASKWPTEPGSLFSISGSIGQTRLMVRKDTFHRVAGARATVANTSHRRRALRQECLDIDVRPPAP